MGVAVAELRDKEGADFALLVCEPHNFGFYRRLGWRQFIGDLFAEQPEGRVRFDVMTPFVFDSGFRRKAARSISGGCRGDTGRG
jgi:hypothetical protein